MRKTGLLLAGAVGFVLGSRSGRRPYEVLEDKARQFAGQPRVQEAKDVVVEKAAQAADVAADKANAAKDAVADKAAETVDAAVDKAHSAKHTVEDKLGSTSKAGEHAAHSH